MDWTRDESLSHSAKVEGAEGMTDFMWRWLKPRIKLAIVHPTIETWVLGLVLGFFSGDPSISSIPTALEALENMLICLHCPTRPSGMPQLGCRASHSQPHYVGLRKHEPSLSTGWPICLLYVVFTMSAALFPKSAQLVAARMRQSRAPFLGPEGVIF